MTRRAPLLLTAATAMLLLWLSACAGGGQQDKGPNPQIAFTRSDDYGLYDIYVVNADGTGETHVTKDFRVLYPPVVWSPDGEKIAFVGEDGLYVVNADGGDPTRLIQAGSTDPAEPEPTRRTTTIREVAWSPDSEKLVFQRVTEEVTEEDATASARANGGSAHVVPEMTGLHVINADGSGLRKLFEVSNQGRLPAWSPDGEKIALVGSSFDYEYVINVVNTDGGGLREYPIPYLTYSPPAWSPDGEKIAVASDNGLFVINTDDGKLREFPTSTRPYGTPAWSPDGEKIAFVPEEGGVYVINADGTSQAPITTTFAVTQIPPVWSPEGKEIAFVGKDGLYIVNADGGDPTRLSDAAGGQITSLSYVPRGSWQR
jgi:Tol biopolymer transport system component